MPRSKGIDECVWCNKRLPKKEMQHTGVGFLCPKCNVSRKRELIVDKRVAKGCYINKLKVKEIIELYENKKR